MASITSLTLRGEACLIKRMSVICHLLLLRVPYSIGFIKKLIRPPKGGIDA